MRANPEHLIFETTSDLVDYVSLGLPPSRKQFDRVMSMVELAAKFQTSQEDQTEGQEPSQECKNIHVTIDFSKMNLGTDDLNMILGRVYHNAKKTRNGWACTSVAMFGLGFLIGSKI